MKFLADMGISPRTVSSLQDQGHDAVHLRERGQEQLEDASVLRLARTERRILLAHDLDSSDLVAAGGRAFPSVIVFWLRNMEPSSVNQRLRQVINRHPDD